MAISPMRYQKAASALRANLKRRKAQVRARAEAEDEAPITSSAIQSEAVSHPAPSDRKS